MVWILRHPERIAPGDRELASGSTLASRILFHLIVVDGAERA
jgi:hypothetical protein